MTAESCGENAETINGDLDDCLEEFFEWPISLPTAPCVVPGGGCH